MDESARALNQQLVDARAALEVLALPGYARIRDYFEARKARYEQLLHATALDKDARQNVCFAVEVCNDFLGIEQHFQKIVKGAETNLKNLEAPQLDPATVGSRLTSFMR
jgi:hypothetical protein